MTRRTRHSRADQDAGLKNDQRRADRLRMSLERQQNLAPDSLAAILRPYVHALDFGRAVLQTPHGATPGGSVSASRDKECDFRCTQGLNVEQVVAIRRIEAVEIPVQFRDELTGLVHPRGCHLDRDIDAPRPHLVRASGYSAASILSSRIFRVSVLRPQPRSFAASCRRPPARASAVRISVRSNSGNASSSSRRDPSSSSRCAQ